MGFRLGLRVPSRNSLVITPFEVTVLSVTLNAAGIRALGKQSFSTAQRYRKYLQPERIDQIMLHDLLTLFFSGVAVRLSPRLRARGSRQARFWLAGVSTSAVKFGFATSRDHGDPTTLHGIV
jgi:hypothetical protein